MNDLNDIRIIKLDGKVRVMQTIWKADGPEDCFGYDSIIPEQSKELNDRQRQIIKSALQK